jgi:hypothetical protein
MKTFLLVYPGPVPNLGSDPFPQDWIVSEIVEKAPGVEEAYAFFGNAVCIRSSGSLRQLHDFLKERYRNMEFFLVDIDTTTKAGLMDETFWRFLKQKALEKPAA